MASEKVSSSMIEQTEKSAHADSLDLNKAEVLVNQDVMNDAYDGENREHAEGMWASFKSHPMACLWAFIMCFTIVRLYQYACKQNNS